MSEQTEPRSRGEKSLSRRGFLRNSASAGLGAALIPVLGQATAFGLNKGAAGAATRILPFDQDWLFGGESKPGDATPAYDDSAFAPVSLPHCVTSLSWQKWLPSSWERVWTYRKHFSVPRDWAGLRIFLEFDGVMVGANPTLNGHTLPTHLGGYLPFQYEITHLLEEKNILAVEVDSRWSNVPPEGAPGGARRVDYLEPGGIYRSVRLKAVPHIFISDLFAKPVNVLEPTRRIEVACTIDVDHLPRQPLQLQVELRQGDRVIARAHAPVHPVKPGQTEMKLDLTHLGNVALWHVDAPHLYRVEATLLAGSQPVHDYAVRIGLRDARFELGGFYLNGSRLQIFGLNRHQYYPYVGGAMPARVQRRDADILRHEFHCNFVRCSHYPQAVEFLDRCDELGLMVWEEPPGWQYIGDAVWKDLVVRDVGEMIVRDRNHPSIVIWGVRINESANDVDLYKRTTAAAKLLDDSRPTSGSMTPSSRKTWKQDWHEDVFAFDDYHSAPDGTVGIRPPTEGVPYMLAEAVGQFSYPAHKGFGNIYRRAGEMNVITQQAIWHAQAHSRAAAQPRICGVVAWCAFEYGSLLAGYNAVKYPGVADFFRIPKLGAAFYRTQVDPGSGVRIEPNFYWDFGYQTPRGPGKQAAIFSNCDRIQVFVDGHLHSTLHPDTANYPHLKHSPFFVDLDLDGSTHPELRLDGYIGSKLAVSRSFSSDPRRDRFHFSADDAELIADGIDMTCLVCKVVDHYGADRAYGTGTVSFQISGPGEIVGDNPLSLTEAGGAAAVWIRTIRNRSGQIRVRATHSVLGSAQAEVTVRRSSREA